MPRKKQTSKKQEEYTAKDIFVLKGLEPVRQRPAMYIGSTGSEGLHHLIWECLDNSLTYETPTIVKENGKIVLRKIGELIDEYFDKNSQFVESSENKEVQFLRKGFKIEALTFDPESLKLKFQPIFSLIRHKVNSEILKVTLQNNREIEITPYHSLFTLKEGEVIPIKGSELKIGTPIVVPKIWPEIENSQKEIDLIDEFLKLDEKKTESVFLYDFKRYDYFPFNLLRKLPQKKIKEFKKKTFLGTWYNTKIQLKPKLKIDRHLAELLGIFAAEGTIIKNNSSKSNRVVFSFGAHENELIDYVCKLIKKVFGLSVSPRYAHNTAKVIIIDSQLIALIFKEVFKTGKNSLQKKVPDLIFNLNKKLRERFLIAYLAGDGYPTKFWTDHLINNTSPSEKERRKFAAVSQNKNLIVGLSYLLSSLNKTYSFSERKVKEKERKIKTNYKGREKERIFHSKAKYFALDFYWNTESSYFNYLPYEEVVQKCFDYEIKTRVQRNSQGGIANATLFKLLEAQKIVLKEGSLRFLNSDLGILRVKKIQKIEYKKPWVYDFSVLKGENFVAGFAPICAHNSVDEALAGYAKNIEVELVKENRVRVSDDGRGIPVDIHPETKKSALETVMTTLHAGAKFGRKVYRVSGGLHGVGISVVCALSSWMRAEVCRQGVKYYQEYSKGKTKTKLKKDGRCKQTGTTVIFEPDAEIFKQIKFERKKILNHLRRQAYLTKGVRIKFIDSTKTPPFEYTFYFEGGLKSYIKYLIGPNTPLHPNVFYVSKEKDGVLVEAAFQYTQERECWEESFANNIHTEDGGTHLTGFRTALTRVLNDYAKKNDLLEDEGFVGQDVREGLSAAVSVKVPEPQFEGQTKTKLGNPEVKTIVESVVSQALADFLERNPQDARIIINNCILTQKARKAAKAARQTVLRKGILEGLSLPGKLADCSTKKPEEAELFIVEGDSAGGCFSGDTKVALVDGRSLTFKELVKEWKEGKINYCYTIKRDGSIGIGKILHPRLTKRKAKVMKVILDNDQEIICTPDHKFMLRDGSYIEARCLKPGMSLMPLYRKLSKKEKRITIEGYEMVFDPKTRHYIFTHLLADKYNQEIGKYKKEENTHCHHLDFNRLNNSPENIIRISKEEHLEIHRKMAQLTLHKPEVKEKCKKIKLSPEYRRKISERMKQLSKLLSERAKKQWQNPEYKEYMKKKYLEFYYSNPEYRRKVLERLYRMQKLYWSKKENRLRQAERTREYFRKHPEAREYLSKTAKKQWENLELRKWRAQKTKEQWTQEFRKKRKKAYNETYLKESLKFLKEILEKHNNLEIYDLERKRLKPKNPNLLRLDTLLDRFFDGKKEKLLEAVEEYNHKVKKVVFLRKRIDVYDLEVPETHNFALAAGVFVHNSAKQARDRRFQAILPLRGKILNVERARLDKILSSQEIKALVIALGCAIAQDFDINKLRYHRIVIMTDADVDGAHIRTLLLTLFYRYFRPVIERGYLYIAQPPLYRIQTGKTIKYAYSDEEKEKIVKELQKSRVGKIEIQRYKGLGEMNPDQLWETTMDPEKRILLQVTIEDAKEADRIFDILMGKEVLPRKKFIQAYARSVKNLDI